VGWKLIIHRFKRIASFDGVAFCKSIITSRNTGKILCGMPLNEKGS
jgi:hypothetical protein